MHIAILGAGPAGLYLAYLIKRRSPETAVTLIEQNPADATFGFGVVFSDRALEFLREDDEATYSAITPHMESWSDITIVHRGERVIAAVRGTGEVSASEHADLERISRIARVATLGGVKGDDVDAESAFDEAESSPDGWAG